MLQLLRCALPPLQGPVKLSEMFCTTAVQMQQCRNDVVLKRDEDARIQAVLRGQINSHVFQLQDWLICMPRPA